MKLTPGSAILWTVLVPGLAHVRLGYVMRGLLAFVTTVGLFAAGAAIVGDRIWYFQLFEPFSVLQPLLERVPVQMLPESINLGCTTVLAYLKGAPVDAQSQQMWDWLRSIRLPVAHEHIGLLLTGSTGILTALWAADANWLVRRVDKPAAPSPARAAFVSWLLPGSGHAMAGQKSKGIAMGVAVIAMFALGLLLSNGNAVDRPQRSAWWIGQILFGGGTALAAVTTAPLEEGYPAPFLDHGVAMCTVAGFMNLIVMIDAYTVTEARVTAGGAVA